MHLYFCKSPMPHVQFSLFTLLNCSILEARTCWLLKSNTMRENRNFHLACRQWTKFPSLPSPIANAMRTGKREKKKKNTFPRLAAGGAIAGSFFFVFKKKSLDMPLPQLASFFPCLHFFPKFRKKTERERKRNCRISFPRREGPSLRHGFFIRFRMNLFFLPSFFGRGIVNAKKAYDSPLLFSFWKVFSREIPVRAFAAKKYHILRTYIAGLTLRGISADFVWNPRKKNRFFGWWQFDMRPNIGL